MIDFDSHYTPQSPTLSIVHLQVLSRHVQKEAIAARWGQRAPLLGHPLRGLASLGGYLPGDARQILKLLLPETGIFVFRSNSQTTEHAKNEVLQPALGPADSTVFRRALENSHGSIDFGRCGSDGVSGPWLTDLGATKVDLELRGDNKLTTGGGLGRRRPGGRTSSGKPKVPGKGSTSPTPKNKGKKQNEETHDCGSRRCGSRGFR